MANPKNIILGDVFEFAFKLGFLKGKVEDYKYESFKEGGFESIRFKFLDKELEELKKVLEEIEKLLEEIDKELEEIEELDKELEEIDEELEELDK